MLLKLCKNNKQNLKQEDERQQQISEIRSSALVLQCLNGGICMILQTYLKTTYIIIYLYRTVSYTCTVYCITVGTENSNLIIND